MIDIIIPPRQRDIGAFSVHRILPYAQHRMVGPFIFFDHMGPAVLPPNTPMSVRPHPHIGLATVTYLYSGQIRHQDSLGYDLVIEPGAINWMIAGKGVVHSERSPAEFAEKGGLVNGIQCWVALPKDDEECDPSFHHHPASTLPEWESNGVKFKLLLGSFAQQQSPVKVFSDMFYVDLQMPKGSRLSLQESHRELAVYLSSGSLRVDSQALEAFSMVVSKHGQSLELEALEDSRLMLLGGESVGERHIFWNFVSSSLETLENAKADWLTGPKLASPRFKPIPGDQSDFVPLP